MMAAHWECTVMETFKSLEVYRLLGCSAVWLWFELTFLQKIGSNQSHTVLHENLKSYNQKLPQHPLLVCGHEELVIFFS
jgi:hypothetical protein